MQILKHIKQYCTSTTSKVNLRCRNYIVPLDFSSDDMKSLLWTAFDLRSLFRHKYYAIKTVQGVRVTLLLHKPDIEIQTTISAAANLLQAQLNTIIDPQWDSHEYLIDTGKYLSICSDIVFCQSKHQKRIQNLSEGATVPIVSVESCRFVMLRVLADMMSLQAKYGHLKNLTLGWVGVPCPLINTYLCIAPRLGINVKYCCSCNPAVSQCPALLKVGEKASKEMHTKLEECKDVTAAITNAHVIATAKHNVPDLKVVLGEITSKADKHWCLLHPLTRGNEVDADVFHHKNSLVWKALYNRRWVYAAIILRLLRHHEHITDMPKFDDDLQCCE